MDIRERWEDFDEAVRMAFDGLLKRLPGVAPAIVAEDSDGHVVHMQPSVKAEVKDKDGKITIVQLPQVRDAPVHFPSGGGVIHTFAIKKGEEGLVAFANRAIDAWHQNGGVQSPISRRLHSLSDALSIVGLRSTPRKIKNYSTESSQLRSDDGKHTVDHHPQNGTTIKSVDASDNAQNPWTSATKYIQSFVKAAAGIAHQAVDGGTTHSVTVTHTDGPKMSANNDAHVVQAHPSDGLKLNSSSKVDVNAPEHNINAQTNVTGGLVADSVQAATAAFSAISMPAIGAAGGGSLAAGEAASNVGTLGGDLDGTLPNPHVIGISHVVGANSLPNCANDAAAATAGVVVGSLYRNGSVLCVRVV